MEIHAWCELLEWSPPLDASRDARRWRFAALLDSYRRTFGDLPWIVKVTGTSGKGSASAMLEAALLADHQAVGLFTSPHLVEVTERIRIGGRDVRSERLDDVASRSSPFFSDFVSEFGPSSRPSFFEALLVLALRLFAEAGCNVAIFEVAVGGHNDVVSLLPGPVAAITSIGSDHLEQLGPTLLDVARDKAGIASPDSTLVIGPGIASALKDAIERSALPLGAHAVDAGDVRAQAVSRGVRGQEVTVHASSGPIRLCLPLPGHFQLDNLKTVFAVIVVLERLGIVADHRCIRGVSRTRWAARLEYFPGAPAWLVDSAHNELAFGALEAFLRSTPELTERTLLIGASNERKAVDALRVLARDCAACHVVGGFYKAVPLGHLKQSIPVCGSEAPRWFGSPADAVESLSREYGGQDRCVVVAGSVYLAGACRELLVQRGYAPVNAAP